MVRIRSAEILYPTDESSPIDFGFSVHDAVDSSLFDIHYELELGVVMEGVMERFWEDDMRELTPGSVWMTGVWEAHGFQLKKAPCKVAVFLVRPELLSSLQLGGLRMPDWMAPFMASPRNRPQLMPSEQSFVLTALHRMNERFLSLVTPHAISDRSISALLLFLEILGTLCRGWEPPQRSTAQLWNEIQPALGAVFSENTPISEKAAAGLCHMSESTFRRKFKQTMGVSFGRFSLNHRLKSAALELTGTHSIQEIAYRWGFSDTSHFYRAFRSVFKETPAQYRQRHR